MSDAPRAPALLRLPHSLPPDPDWNHRHGPSSPASLHPALIPRGGGSSRGPVWNHEEVAGHPPRVFQGFLLFSWTEGIKLAAMERKVGMQRHRIASLSASVYTANAFSAFVISKRFCLARESYSDVYTIVILLVSCIATNWQYYWTLNNPARLIDTCQLKYYSCHSIVICKECFIFLLPYDDTVLYSLEIACLVITSNSLSQNFFQLLFYGCTSCNLHDEHPHWAQHLLCIVSMCFQTVLFAILKFVIPEEAYPFSNTTSHLLLYHKY